MLLFPYYMFKIMKWMYWCQIQHPDCWQSTKAGRVAEEGNNQKTSGVVRTKVATANEDRKSC